MSDALYNLFILSMEVIANGFGVWLAYWIVAD